MIAYTRMSSSVIFMGISLFSRRVLFRFGMLGLRRSMLMQSCM